ncbi:hypothetical protein [Microvirus mar65]|uniref:Uncharacterized protein n=1 Tax=Microvirus mar65 TaxID=2851202 RepID=A0A8F5RBY0_9VIRU|nr:hypothetical protein [Microvirus mar65]
MNRVTIYLHDIDRCLYTEIFDTFIDSSSSDDVMNYINSVLTCNLPGFQPFADWSDFDDCYSVDHPLFDHCFGQYYFSIYTVY